ncbi:MAG TPA: HlyD family efflux transporter periplasmic adaptor subunit [Wenzhouxiangellaceae bacterium]|nr:HlyD family efflux transporter periplasmic adaptor subunit [Wenzhouxiangellaceae bacterium]
MSLQIPERFLIPAPLIALWVALLTGCGGSEPGGHSHAPGEPEHDPAAEAATEVVTDYTAASELFVEFPPLVVDRGSRFAAHVTRLADFAPVRSGRMDVVLLRDGQTAARFRVDAPARAGLFTPTVTPQESGAFELRIEVEAPGLKVVHELGAYRVYADADSARTITETPPGEIGYLKEQQWTTPFATEAVRAMPIQASVPGVAQVRAPADGGAVVAAPDDGYFTSVDVPRIGGSVDIGEVLGYLVPRLGEGTDVGRLAVELERARNRTNLARRDVQRLESLVATGAVPERRLIEARAELDIAQSELVSARGRIEQRQGGAAGSGIALKAPVAGQIVDVAVAPGAFVRSGEPLFWLADPARRWLEVRVPEARASQLDQATGAWFVSGKETVVLDAAHGARVVQVSRRVDPVSRTVAVTIEYPILHIESGSAGDSASGDRPIPGAPTLVGLGLAAHVQVGASSERLAVPKSAIIDDGGRTVVYVQTGGETFQRRPIETGIRDGDRVEIVSGLAAGERVVTIGAYDVKLAATGGEEVGHGHAH